MSYAKFNTSFRRAAVAVAEELGLEFISTKRQLNNGTLKFHDPKTDAQYALCESGYIRRYVKGFKHSFMTETPIYHYPLNTRNKLWAANTTYDLAGPNEQLGIMVRAINNYRQKTKS